MRVNENHRLVADNGRLVPFELTNNKGAQFGSGRPSYLIMHYTAGGTADGAISWFRNRESDASAHLVIDHNGAITQMVPFNTVAWHAGRSSWRNLVGMNQYAIGIEIVNWGLLNGEPGNWRNRVGGRVPDERVIRARHKNFDPSTMHGWEIFEQAQMEAALLAASAIVKHYGIPEQNLLGHDDVSPGRKQDPGPAFNLERFRAQLYGRSSNSDNLFKVVSGTGLTLRTGPGVSFNAIEMLKDGSLVRQIGADGVWFEVNPLSTGAPQDKIGWVHSGWLEAA